MHTRWVWRAAACLLLAISGCREPDGPLGGDDAGVLVVRSDPPGASIRLDGRATGKVTPDTLRGLAGLHEVVVTLDTAQLTYGYSANVVVQSATEPTVLNGPLMARCQTSASDCAAPFRKEHQVGTARFASNAIGALFLQAGQGRGLYWPGNTENSYLSTGTPMFAARWNGAPVSTGIYDTRMLAGRPAPQAITAGGQFSLTQTAWFVPPLNMQQLTLARGIEIREQLLAAASAEALFLVRLTFRNITRDSLYGLVDQPVGQLAAGITFEEAYIGLALDADIGSAGDDWVSYDVEQTAVYAYDAAFNEGTFTVDPNAPALVGMKVLRRPPGTEVVLNAWARESAGDWEAGTSTQTAGYGMLSGTSSYTPDQPGTTFGHLPPGAGDVRTTATVGPLRLAPGDSATVILAVALAPPAPGTFTTGTQLAPGDPADTARQLHAVAALLRQRLAAADTLMGVLGL